MAPYVHVERNIQILCSVPHVITVSIMLNFVFQSLINEVRSTTSCHFVNYGTLVLTISETDVLNSKNITCLCCYRIGTERSFGPFRQLICCN